MSGSSGPTLTGFQWFIANVMNISTIYLPTSSPIIAWCLAIALDFVNPDLASIGNSVPGLPATNLYNVATYNLAGSLLLNFAIDQPGQTYFDDLRKSMNMTTFVAGVVSSTADEGTSAGILNPEFMNGLTLADLQRLKDPYGRMYLQIAQLAGPTIWGLT